MRVSTQLGTLLITAAMVAFTTSCTRVTEDSAAATFELPMPSQKAGALNTRVPKHYIINISGPGMNLIHCYIDIERGRTTGPCQWSLPTVSITLPRGTSRLVQLLRADEVDSTTGGDHNYFSYGDAIANFDTPNVNVEVAMSDINAGGTSEFYVGFVGGRFLDTANSGPTGPLELRIKPRTDRPGMLFTSGEIFNGWFRTMGITQLPIEYSVSGRVLMTGSMAQLDADGAGSRVVSNLVPTAGEEEVYAFGWFGPGVPAAYYIDTSGTCFSAGVTEYSNCLVLNKPFLPPFKPVDGDDFLLMGTNSVSYAFLPGTEAVVTGVEVFYHPSLGGRHPEVIESAEQDNLRILGQFQPTFTTFDCNAFRNYVGVERIGVGNQTSVTLPNLQQNIINNPLAQAVICPAQGSKLYSSVLSKPDLEDRGGDDGRPYLRMEIDQALHNNETTILTNNVCHPFKIRLFSPQQNNGGPVPIFLPPSSFTIQFGFQNSPWGAIFNNPTDCGSNINQLAPVNGLYNYTINPSGEGTTLYIRSNGGTFQNKRISTANIPPEFRSEITNQIFESHLPMLSFVAPSGPFLTDTCYQVQVDRTGALTNGLTVNLSGGVGLYSEHTCSTQLSPAEKSITAGMQRSTAFYFKASDTNSTLTAAASGYTSASLSSVSITALGINSKNPTRLVLRLPTGMSYLPANHCSSIIAELQNTSGQVVPAIGPISFPLEANWGSNSFEIYNTHDCTSTPSDKIVTFMAGESQRYIPIKILRSIGHNESSFTLSSASGTTQTVAALPIPQPSNQLKINFPSWAIGKIVQGVEWVDPGQAHRTLTISGGSGPYSCTKYSWVSNMWTQITCNGHLNGNLFTWPLAETADANTKFKIQDSLGQFIEFTTETYNFRAFACDVTLGASITAVAGIITDDATHAVLPGKTICLAANTTTTIAKSIELDEFSKIIGPANTTEASMPLLQMTALAPAVSKTNAHQTSMIANLKVNYQPPSPHYFPDPAIIDLPSGGMLLNSIVMTNASGGTFERIISILGVGPDPAISRTAKISKVRLESGSSNPSGVFINSYEGVIVNELEIRANGEGVGVDLINNLTQANWYADSNKIGKIQLNKVSFQKLDGTRSSGQLLSISYTQGQNVNVSLSNSKFARSGTSTYPIISVGPAVSLNLFNNVLESTDEAIVFFNNSVPSNHTFANNTFIMKAQFHPLYFSAAPHSIGLNNNHFLKIAGGNTTGALGASSSNLTIIAIPGQNYFCGLNNSHSWSSVVDNWTSTLTGAPDDNEKKIGIIDPNGPSPTCQ